jgi:hypothetical protein
MMSKPIRVALPMLLLCAATAVAAEPPTQPAATTPAAPKKSTDAQPAVDTSAPKAAPAATGRRAQNDRLDLDTTIVTGNRELPKVLYIVPWKKAELGDLPAQPFNTLLDEVLTPVDRDVFRREVTYYGVVSAGGNASPATAAPAADPSGAPRGGDEK